MKHTLNYSETPKTYIEQIWVNSLTFLWCSYLQTIYFLIKYTYLIHCISFFYLNKYSVKHLPLCTLQNHYFTTII
jgi:hypothetical protein